MITLTRNGSTATWDRGALSGDSTITETLETAARLYKGALVSLTVTGPTVLPSLATEESVVALAMVTDIEWSGKVPGLDGGCLDSPTDILKHAAVGPNGEHPSGSLQQVHDGKGGGADTSLLGKPGGWDQMLQNRYETSKKLIDESFTTAMLDISVEHRDPSERDGTRSSLFKVLNAEGFTETWRLTFTENLDGMYVEIAPDEPTERQSTESFKLWGPLKGNPMALLDAAREQWMNPFLAAEFPDQHGFIANWRQAKNLWPAYVQTLHSDELKAQTDAAIAKTLEYMKADPRWEEAAEQWSHLDSTSTGSDDLYNEAQKLSGDMNMYAGLILGDDWWNSGDYDTLDSDEGGAYILKDALEKTFTLGDDASDFDVLAIDSLNGDTIEEPDEWMAQTVRTTARDNQNDTWKLVSPKVDASGDLTLVRTGHLGGLFRETATGELVPNAVVGDSFPISRNMEIGPPTIKVPWETVYSADDILVPYPDADAMSTFDYFVSDYDQFVTENGHSPYSIMALIEQGELQGAYDGGTMGDANAGADLANAQTLVVNDSYNNGGVQIAASAEDVPLVMRNLWANTSGDDHPWSLAAQVAVAEEFGTHPRSPVWGYLAASGYDMTDTVREINDNFGTGLRVWARAIYNQTQDFFTEQGIESLPVARGMGVSHGRFDELHSDINEVIENAAGRMGYDINDPDFGDIKANTDVYDAFEATWLPVKADLNPMSAWSVDPQTAESFTRRKSVSIGLRGRVTKDKIWGVSLIGNGSAKEYEVILLGGPDAFDGEMIYSDGTLHGFHWDWRSGKQRDEDVWRWADKLTGGDS